MIRASIAILLLLAASGYDESIDSDEATKRLDEAKTAYQLERDEITASIMEFFDQSEAKARSRGDKREVDAVKVARQAFESEGKLPTTIPAKITKRIASSYTDMESAYATAISDYTKASEDAMASLIETELDDFKSANGMNPFALIGTWSVSCCGGFTADWTFTPDGRVVSSNAKSNGKADRASCGEGRWGFDAKKSYVRIHWQNGNKEALFAPIFPKLTTGVQIGRGNNQISATKKATTPRVP